MKRIYCCAALIVCAAGGLFAQSGARLGLEVTPKNFDAAIASATARAGKNELPPFVDLAPYFPRPGHQGTQNSCVAWAAAYGVKSYQENRRRSWGTNSNDTVFSPSFIYNQINKGRDGGSTIPDALELVKTQGAATLKTMPYGDYREQPPQRAREEASRFRIESYEKLDGKNTASLKMVLAGGNPIIVGMKTYENFPSYSGGVYRRVSGAHLGGHAMVITGYDDSKNAFKILNSWGEGWGEKGFVWYDYGLFAEMNHTAMVMYAKPDNTPVASYPPNSLTASAGSYSDKIQLSWEGVKNAEYYSVFRADGGPDTFTKIADVKGTVFIDTRVRQKTEYYYAVKSVGPAGESGFSAAALGYLKKGEALGSPRNLMGRYENRSIKLLWDSVQGAEGYHIYRWDEGASEWARIGTSSNEGYADTKLPASSTGERYVVSAWAKDRESKAGPALYVAAPPAREPPKPPQPPAWVKASQGTFRDKIELSWEAVSGASVYIVRKWSSRNRAWLEIARTGSLSYSDVNVPEKKALYSVITLRGTEASEPSVLAEGSLATAPKKDSPRSFADDSYRESFFTRPEKFFSDTKFFSDDTFFTGEASFFDNFEEEDFFFSDAQAFFHVDTEKFFGKDSGDFFRTDDDFF
ncbi:MAG: hypothetical protein LBC67_07775 [Spirochaetales bacterium]|jgi:fibronectin type 3 domain-containing protein|nr:hypothetical protein [Spirochaetales bacterium]